MATPALGALVWLGTFPPPKVIILGLITAFAGYTVVYALNDLIDHHVDQEKIQQGGFLDSEEDLDTVLVRHPVARGLLSFKEGFLWTAAWAFLALLGAYKLNPACLLIFVIGCMLEIVYCLMLRVSHLRTIVSGAVKTSGGLAAVFAVDPNPSPPLLIILFLWFFFWEIGGQNIPNDWSDIREDKRIQAKTIPLRFGPVRANVIILGTLILAIAMNMVLFRLAQVNFGLPYMVVSFFVGFYFLLIPAFRLSKTKKRQYALALFNRASYYPLALLVLVIIKIMI
jgi:4-hydroxybenzoate polyprenyltransferase